MTDQPMGQQSPAEGTPEASMPNAEQSFAEDTKTGEVARSEVPSQETESSELGDQVKERTRFEFDKLKNQLREERSRREYVEQVFASMRPKPQEIPKAPPLIDPETGLLNEGGLTDIQRRAMAAEERATRAEEQVHSYLIEQEKKETFAEFPELDPEGKSGKKHDKQLHIATRSLLLDSMMNPEDYGGKELSFKEAAAMAKNLSKPAMEAVQKEAAQQAIEQLTPKEQAALTASGVPQRRNQLTADISELQTRTRKGDNTAIVERLKGVPWSNRG